ncbi:MAG: hypothetical protein ABFD07_03365 [Methanobacterium sp.]
MNTIGEILDIKQASCREIYIPDLMSLLKQDVNIFFSWGADGFRVDNHNSTKMFRMTVRGHHHKGYVYIFLNGLDLFDVYLTNYKNVIKDRTDEMGLYFDQFVEWIDNKVERIPEYKS